MTNLHDTNYKRTFIDQGSGAQIGLTNLHAHIHRGKAFQVEQSVTALADNGYVNFEITTPENDDVHLKESFIWISEGPVIFSITENPTLTTGAAALTPVNRNRTKVKAVVLKSDTIIKSNPTSISGGSVLTAPEFGVSGIGSQTNPMLVSSQNEWVLDKGNNIFLARLQNVSGGNINVYMNLIWYE